MVDLAYNENVLEHKNFADTLGSLQARVVKGTVTSSTANSYYMGAELLKIFPTAKAQGEYFLKCDATGSGSGNSNRSKNRVVVKVGADGKLVENVAYIWRHDNRVEKLGAGFFKRAEFYRNMS